MEPKPGSTFYIVPNDWSNNLTTHIRGKIEFGNGSSDTTYGATTIKGEKGGWSGINFKNGAWVNSGTLMMHPSYSGFYNNSDTNWRWYTDNSGNTYQPGIGQATDFCVYGTSKCLSTVSGSVGPQGPAGATGATGATGPQGPAGSTTPIPGSTCGYSSWCDSWECNDGTIQFGTISCQGLNPRSGCPSGYLRHGGGGSSQSGVAWCVKQ